MNLRTNIHEKLPLPPSTAKSVFVKGDYKYYHYACDGFKDHGWGCGYRTLQTLCSWIQQNNPAKTLSPPSIPEIQATLVQMNDKPASFLNSRDWIGSVEVALVLDQLYDIPCKILHCPSLSALLDTHWPTLWSHFEKLGSPIMVGGGSDHASKGIFGLCETPDWKFALVLDPHYSGTEYKNMEEWVRWDNLALTWHPSSFYNLCLPQMRSSHL